MVGDIKIEKILNGEIVPKEAKMSLSTYIKLLHEALSLMPTTPPHGTTEYKEPRPLITLMNDQEQCPYTHSPRLVNTSATLDI